jgi:hypothetical protein
VSPTKVEELWERDSSVFDLNRAAFRCHRDILCLRLDWTAVYPDFPIRGMKGLLESGTISCLGQELSRNLHRLLMAINVELTLEVDRKEGYEISLVILDLIMPKHARNQNNWGLLDIDPKQSSYGR